MIPTTNVDNQLTGSLGGTRTAMSVDLSSLSHIMTVLTDLYSDPELAVIREYSTNARDSQTMAGVNRPIEVSLPTALRQTFEVRDFGQGMSPAEITEVYGSYGASTKRDRNDANGCLGLGSKSALTYTNMFTVRAVKNGTLTECAIYRDEFGAGSIEVVDTKATDEPNGVTIIVPTSSNSSFEAKAKQFYSVWDKGTVLVDGVQPYHVTDEPFHLWMDDKTLVIPCRNNSYGDNASSFVVMGGVSYPANNEGSRWASYKTYYFAAMDGDNGLAEVDFVPSREALNFNDKTKDVVNGFAQNASKGRITTKVQRMVDACKTIDDAVKMSVDYSYAADYKGFYYKGDQIVDRLYLDGKNVRQFDHLATEPTQMNNKITLISTREKDRYVWVTNQQNKPFTFSMKAKIRKYAEGLKFDPIFILAEPPVHAQFAGMHKVSWKKLDAIVIPKAVRGQSAPKPQPEYKYSYQGRSSYFKSALPTDPKTNFVYVNGNPPHMVTDWTKEDQTLCVVWMPETRLARFKRDNPTAKSLSEFRDEKAKALPTLTELQIEFLSLDMRTKRVLQELKGKTNDKHIDKLASVDAAAVDLVVKRWYNYDKEVARVANYFETKYPLANYGSHPAETIDYINFVTGKVN